jgi:long-chain acyl-CoA synthetase
VICPDRTKVTQYLSKVKPTMLFAVPRVWCNALNNGDQQLMAAESAFVPALDALHKQRHDLVPHAAELEALASAQAELFPKLRGLLGGQLRVGFSGTAQLPRVIAELIDALGIAMYEGYGLTESSGCTTVQPHGRTRTGSVGRAIPGMRVEIDPIHGTGQGEIVVYGSGVMQGYWKAPVATRKALTADGGLRTGDVGHLDDDGLLHISGRVQELLEDREYGALLSVAHVLVLSPFLCYAFVFGAGRPYNVAVIIADSRALADWAQTHGLTAEGDALLFEPRIRELFEAEVATANERLHDHERIHRFTIEPEEPFYSSGVFSPTFCIRRRIVYRRYRDVVESLYAATAPDRPAPHAWHIQEFARELGRAE